jgi:hypothetical protein
MPLFPEEAGCHCTVNTATETDDDFQLLISSFISVFSVIYFA